VETCSLKIPKLYPKQHAAIFDPARYSLCWASTKAGKTVACMAWILFMAWNCTMNGANFWWVAPTVEVSEIAYTRLKRMLFKMDPNKVIWESNDTKRRIHLKGQNTFIWFKGSDKPDSLYGEDVYGAVVDEASRCKEGSWFAIRSTLTATKGPIRIIGNVKGRKNWAYKLGERAKQGAPNMAFHKITAYDAVEAGVLDAAEIEDAKAILPDAVFRELYLAEPSDDQGNPFGIKYIAECFTPYTPGKPICYGVDLAKSHDWTVVIGLDELGRECFFERWQGPWRDTKAKLLRILDAPAMMDATGVGNPIVEEMQHDGGNEVEGFNFSSKSKQQIMEGLAAAIQSGNMRLANAILRSELESFEYEYTRTGVTYTAPEGLFDDCVCALALARDKWGRMVRSPVPFIHAIDADSEPHLARSITEDDDFGWESV